ncbi:hypothetical protein [Nocardia wallacei]|uniref:hypothetical protein n=1 Tax=Nocardia wallacei TaxID=480035 RepID=UPI0024537ABA|nr:hypothetical protein [Nocardia wallacei]
MELIGYVAPERPCRVNAYSVEQPQDPFLRWERLYLNSQLLPIRHIEACFGGQYVPQYVQPALSGAYNRCLEWPEGLPGSVLPLVNILSTGLVLPTMGSALDLALAIDWYKIVDESIASTEWSNSEAGEMVHRAKYYVNSPDLRTHARGMLIRKLVAMVVQHPALAAARYIVSVPGSKGDGHSTGELLAAGVAAATGKQFVATIGPERPARKGDQTYQLRGLFSVPVMMSAPCVIVDDVVRSGSTLREVGLLAKQAGATQVYGLAAAKTLRS